MRRADVQPWDGRSGTRWRTLAFISCLVATTGRVSTATASVDDDDAILSGAVDSRSLSDEGMASFKRGDYDRAIAAFQKAYELSPSPALLFDLGQSYRKKGECTAALAMFRRFALADPGASQRSRVQDRIEEMAACAPAVVPAPSAPALASRSPGPAEQGSRLPVRVGNGAAGGQGSAPSTIRKEASRGWRTAALVVTATGLVALGLGAFSSVQAVRASDDVSAVFHSGGDWTPSDDATVARGRRYETLSKVMYVSAGAALAAGVGLYYLGARRGSSADVVVFTLPGGGAVAWEGCF